MKLKSYEGEFVREACLLNPVRASKTLPITESKIGGRPHAGGFEAWPSCKGCGSSLNFTLQLFSEHFNSFPFPADANLFQLYRCPNKYCPEANSERSDARLYWFYWQSNAGDGRQLSRPDQSASATETGTQDSATLENWPEFAKWDALLAQQQFEKEVIECIFRPARIDDYPELQELWELIDPEKHPDLAELSQQLSDSGNWSKLKKQLDELETVMTAKKGCKIGGYPSWQQSVQHQQCDCGMKMDFFFQLASQEPNHARRKKSWSEHGLMIGDLGNIYFFICSKCGPQSITTSWDCG